MTRTECDNCRRLDYAPSPPGWVVAWIVVPVEAPEGDDSPYANGMEIAGMFCGWPCVAQYATVKALIPAEDPQGGAS